MILSEDPKHCGGCDKACGPGQSCKASRCECGGGQTACKEGCVDLSQDPTSCGKCGQSCKSDELCKAGKCEPKLSCSAYTPDRCDGACVNVRVDPKHCGSCGRPCQGGTLCQNGQCQCPEGLLSCRGQCVDPLSSADHCGACDRKCKAGTFCASGRCLATCPKATPHQCQGACVELQSYRLHCGSCGNRCQGGTQCISGKCQCPAGWLICEGECIDPRYHLKHCGACGKSCSSGARCADGRCQATCPKSTPTACFGGCVDRSTNPRHCGECGRACGGGQRCVKGQCQCPQGTQLCNGRCEDTNSTVVHCGGCNQACKGEQVCHRGQCADRCPDTLPDACLGGCVNLKQDPQNCGGCNKPCPQGQACSFGRCVGSCSTVLLKDCNGSCVDPQNDPGHCGTCDNKCAANEKCVEGACTPPGRCKGDADCPPGQECQSGSCKPAATATPASVALLGAPAVLARGTSYPLQAAVYDSAGTRIHGSFHFLWKSSSAAVAQVDSKGVLLAGSQDGQSSLTVSLSQPRLSSAPVTVRNLDPLQPGRLRITVYDRDSRKAIPNATVLVGTTKGATDTGGIFRLNNKPSTYNVHIFHKQYSYFSAYGSSASDLFIELQAKRPAPPVAAGAKVQLDFTRLQHLLQIPNQDWSDYVVGYAFVGLSLPVEGFLGLDPGGLLGAGYKVDLFGQTLPLPSGFVMALASGGKGEGVALTQAGARDFWALGGKFKLAEITPLYPKCRRWKSH